MTDPTTPTHAFMFSPRAKAFQYNGNNAGEVATFVQQQLHLDNTPPFGIASDSMQLRVATSGSGTMVTQYHIPDGCYVVVFLGDIKIVRHLDI